MLCSQIISKDKFDNYLHKTLINKEYLEKFALLFDQLRDISKHEKLMFLLYNEYISIYEVFNCLNALEGTFNLTAINNILATHNSKFESPYAYIRDIFFRDRVTTLTYENYKNVGNMKDQMDIIYETLAKDEQIFLSSSLNITKSNFIDLVRIQTDSNTIELAKVEQNSNKLNLVTSILSETKIYNEDGVKNMSLTEQSDLLKSVLKKIDLGTIH